MELARFPTHLRLVRPQERAEAASPALRRRLLSRRELLHRLDAVAELAPRAPLSFLAVRIEGLEEVEEERGEVGVRFSARAVGDALAQLCRGTDLAGELGTGVLGVVLQGAGATAAAAAAARLTHHLNRLRHLPPGCSVVVGAATGTGSHGRRLVSAALEMYESGGYEA